MHSSYALASSEIRRGARRRLVAARRPLARGYRPDDRLGVVLANPMDACGCSNLICGTNTLFYDDLRATRGVGNFFRYADTFLFGVGCEPGDFNQLDVWPLHKFVTVLQPTAEALIEMLNDRRITLLAIPDTGARCRGEVVLSTWNTYLETVRCVVTYSPRTGKARDADVTLVGNRVVESYVEQAIFTTPGIGAGEQARLRRLRRNLDREPMQASRRTARCPTPRPRGRCSASAGAAAGPPGAQPPRRSRRRSRRSSSRCRRSISWRRRLRCPISRVSPSDGAYPAARAAGTDVQDALLHTRLRRDPAPPGRHVRGVGGLGVDLRLRRSHRRAPRRARGGRHLGRVAPAEVAVPGPDALAAADYCFANNMASLEVGQCRYGRSSTRGARCRRRRRVQRRRPRTSLLVVTALPSDADHFRRVTAGKFDVEIVEDRSAHAAPAGAGAALARADRLADRRRRRRAALLPVHPRADHDRRRAELHPGAHRLLGRARLRDLRASRSTPSGCGRRCSTRARRWASSRTASRRSSRCASSRA